MSLIIFGIFNRFVLHAGATCDGQYAISDSFSQRLAERVGVITAGDLAMPVTWDAAHLLNLAITDIREGKKEYGSSAAYLKRTVNRCNVFASEMNIGKGNFVLTATAKHHKETAHAPATFATQR